MREGLPVLSVSPSSKQRSPQKVRRQCGEQRQRDAAQAHAREEDRPQRNRHPGQGAERDSGRKDAPHEHVGCRQPQHRDEGRGQAQHKAFAPIAPNIPATR